jgi:phosphoribosylglycinamide formyltransferase-1
VITLGVLLSGTGSNFRAILEAIGQGRLHAKVGVVVSNVDSAGGLEIARKAGIPTAVIDHREYASRRRFDDAVVQALNAHRVEWVVLAGFMRVVTEHMLEAFPMRILNIHPSLLPAFPGMNAQTQAFQYGARVSGCTVHFVDTGTDTGPIIAQAVVPVLPTDDDDTLRRRILVQEHALYPDVLQWIAEGRVSVVPSPRGGRPRVEVAGVDPFRFAPAAPVPPPSAPRSGPLR